MDQSQSMAGKMADLNVWSFPMSHEDIDALYSIAEPMGNVVNKNTLKMRGLVQRNSLTLTKTTLAGKTIINHWTPLSVLH